MSSSEAVRDAGSSQQQARQGNVPPIRLWINARSPPDYFENMVADFGSEPLSGEESTPGRWRIGSEETRRLVIVGDVHGQLAELRKLLHDIGFDKGAGDHLILVGDLVNKGPDSAGVVQFAMDNGAYAVLGNNDERALLAARLMKKSQADGVGVGVGVGPDVDESGELKTTQDAEHPEPTASHIILPNLVEKDYQTAATLTEDQISWLSSLPTILRIGSFTNATEAPWNSGSVIVVHAGLVPGLPLEEHDPWAVMNMRSLVYPDDDKEKENIRTAIIKAGRGRVRGRTPNCSITDEEVDAELAQLEVSEQASLDNWTIPIEGNEGDSWSSAWNRRQNLLQNPGDRAVAVYGHDAGGGLKIEPNVEVRESPREDANMIQGLRYAFGLDSGCVYGRQLTALVVEEKRGGGGVAHRIVQVDYIKPDAKEDEEK